jgi:hypothetical protein
LAGKNKAAGGFIIKNLPAAIFNLKALSTNSETNLDKGKGQRVKGKG